MLQTRESSEVMSGGKTVVAYGVVIAFSFCFFVADVIVLPVSLEAASMIWNLADDYRTASRPENPNADRYGEPSWYFLQTTGRTPDLANRRWLRDGKYAPLEIFATPLFDLPVEAWAKHPVGDYRMPVIGRFYLQHDLDLRFESGDILFVPGLDDACVLGWRSPVSGTLEIEGAFQHTRSDPAENQGINWYIERGPAPHPDKGFTPIELAAGSSRYGTASQVGSFHITGQSVKPGDFVYFIVDAKADGNEKQHLGDFTRVRAKLTVHDAVEQTTPDFAREVLPILASRCHGCHGADAKKSGLDLRTVTAMLRGGKRGPAAVRGLPNSSYLLQRVQRGEMPPKGTERPTAEEISILARWIRHGMPADEEVVESLRPSLVSDEDRRHWAFQKLTAVEPPEPQVTGRVRTVIDAFLLKRLEQEGLGYAGETAPVTLLRRAYLDLTGLPPSPEQVDEFLTETTPDAFELLIDRLLESSAFGERWARHWLDVVGYADTVGFDHVPNLIILTDGKWRYRDYVINAFNDDKPYDRFIREQIAGDEMVKWRGAENFTDEIREHLVATGFLRTARDQTHEPESNIPLNYFDVLHDTVDILGSSLLGLTMQCARCHNHKFDPIPQEDYYRLMAIFTPAFNPDRWKPVYGYKSYIDDRAIADVPESENDGIRRVDQRISELRPKLDGLRDSTRQRVFSEKLLELPETIRGDVKSALEAAEAERNELQSYLAKKFGDLLTISNEDVEAALQGEERTLVKSLEGQIAELKRQRVSWGRIQAIFDVGPPPPTFLLERGEYQNLGREIVPGFLRILCDPGTQTTVQIEPVGKDTSGRRTALARWLTDGETPAGALMARVMINRIWQHLFGVGLVNTPGNFGVLGEPPTHPELFEWLSYRFVQDGWRVKPMIKLIMMSSAYRQTSQDQMAVATARGGKQISSTSTDGPVSTQIPDPQKVDPKNRLLWRMHLRRLEAEIVRDSILAVSGKLDNTAGGPPVMLKFRADGKIVVDESKQATPTAKWRRSVYLLFRRAYNLSMLSVFDQPLISTSCARRDTSAVPLQSLTMLNDEFVDEHAGHFADRLLKQVGNVPTGLITAAYRTALARKPDENEVALCSAALARQTKLYRDSGVSDGQAKQQALRELCHTLLNTSEFLYVE